jgi:hypothetical protein
MHRIIAVVLVLTSTAFADDGKRPLTKQEQLRVRKGLPPEPTEEERRAAVRERLGDEVGPGSMSPECWAKIEKSAYTGNAWQIDPMLNSLKGHIQRHMQDDAPAFEPTTEDLQRQLADMDEMFAQVRCLRPTTADKREKTVEGWREKKKAALAALIEKRKACTADPACLGREVLAELCPALDRQDEVKGSIKENLAMARQTGVINKKEQYDLGEELKDLNAQVATLKDRYKGATKKPFTKKLCP